MDNIIVRYFTDFTPQQEAQFKALQELYTEWNQQINVISRKDMHNFYLHHVLHSLAIATQFDFVKDMKVMDLGTGGGFPGVPLAILFPDTHFHLVDSIGKKLKVVEAVKEALGLQNITTQHARAEDIKPRKFDCVVSRAVAPLKDLLRWSRPLITKNPSIPGHNVPNGLICLKGGDLAAEIHDSNSRPMVWEIDKIFPEEHFRDKFLLYVKF